MKEFAEKINAEIFKKSKRKTQNSKCKKIAIFSLKNTSKNPKR
jgi:hypothetical protein